MNRLVGMAVGAARRLLQRRGAVVLLYHRVCEQPVDPWGVAVTPRHFDEHLELVSRYMRPVRASELADSLERGGRVDGTVAMTFDDGYADLLDEAKPRLARAGVPATAFVVTGAIGNRRAFWWDDVSRVLLETPRLPACLALSIGGSVRRWRVGHLCETERWRAWAAPCCERHALYRELWQLLSDLPPPQQRDAIDAMTGWAAIGPTTRPTHRTLTDAELGALADGGLVEIGGHTVNHPSLARLAPDDQRREMDGCRAWLRERLGRPIDAFSYPFGGSKHVSDATVSIARETGFRSAFLNVPGLASTRTDRHRIPRVFVDDGDGDQLARTLRRVTGVRIRS
jgi:peptidoglycan/xylan/chitin deacetylase (PgdA/CDA1 family)